jgi:hypothetical protein
VRASRHVGGATGDEDKENNRDDEGDGEYKQCAQDSIWPRTAGDRASVTPTDARVDLSWALVLRHQSDAPSQILPTVVIRVVAVGGIS